MNISNLSTYHLDERFPHGIPNLFRNISILKKAGYFVRKKK